MNTSWAMASRTPSPAPENQIIILEKTPPQSARPGSLQAPASPRAGSRDKTPATARHSAPAPHTPVAAAPLVTGPVIPIRGQSANDSAINPSNQFGVTTV